MSKSSDNMSSPEKDKLLLKKKLKAILKSENIKSLHDDDMCVHTFPVAPVNMMSDNPDKLEKRKRKMVEQKQVATENNINVSKKAKDIKSSHVKSRKTGDLENKMISVISDILNENAGGEYLNLVNVDEPENIIKQAEKPFCDSKSVIKRSKAKIKNKKLTKSVEKTFHKTEPHQKLIAQSSDVNIIAGIRKIKHLNTDNLDINREKVKNASVSPLISVQKNIDTSIKDSNYVAMEENDFFNDPDESIFDENGSLAQKILARLKEKDKQKVKDHKQDRNIKSADSKKQKQAVFMAHGPLALLNKSKYRFPSKTIQNNYAYSSSFTEIFKKPKSFDNWTVHSYDIIVSDKPNDESKQEEEDVNLSKVLDYQDTNLITDNELIDAPHFIAKDDEIKSQSYKIFALNNVCVAVVKSSSNLYFCGKLKASLLFGNVKVLGYKLSEKPEEFYSVSTMSLLCFEASNGDGDTDELSTKLNRIGASNSKIYAIMEFVSSDDSVLLLEPLENVMTGFVKKHLTSFDVFSKPKDTCSAEDDEILKLLNCTFYDESYAGKLKKNDMWDNITTDVFCNAKKRASKNITMICGGKNTGKSTLLRYLVNKGVQNGPVLILDFDPGQPEFTVSGLLSAILIQKPLLGPNFTHLTVPEKSLCLGYISVIENVERYTNSVIKLFDFCKNSKKYEGIPWIINTMGFVGSLGLKLITIIMNIIKPDIVIEIHSTNPKNNFNINLTAGNINDYQQSKEFLSYQTGNPAIEHDFKYYFSEPFQWESGKSSEFTLSRHIEAKTERLLNVLAYFSQMASKSTLTILDIKPYMISMDALGLVFNNILVENEYLPAILNGQLVAMCDQDHDVEQNNIYRLGKDPVVCYGYGIIRGIDPIKRTLYILTPLGMDILAKVNTLVHAETLPDCCSILSAPSLGPKMMIPYASPRKEISEHKHLHQIPKRKFNPLRLLEIAKLNKT